MEGMAMVAGMNGRVGLGVGVAVGALGLLVLAMVVGVRIHSGASQGLAVTVLDTGNFVSVECDANPFTAHVAGSLDFTIQPPVAGKLAPISPSCTASGAVVSGINGETSVTVGSCTATGVGLPIEISSFPSTIKSSGWMCGVDTSELRVYGNTATDDPDIAFSVQTLGSSSYNAADRVDNLAAPGVVLYGPSGRISATALADGSSSDEDASVNGEVSSFGSSGEARLFVEASVFAVATSTQQDTITFQYDSSP